MVTKAPLLFLIILCCLSCCSKLMAKEGKKTITISGNVTDFNDNAIDSAVVRIFHNDFSIAYETHSDKNGKYSFDSIKAGNYLAMYVIRQKEYPRMNAVLENDMRLEFWAWNIIADSDLIINPHYHKLELYGTTVFEEFGGLPELYVYFRPMSVTKCINYGKDIYTDKNKMEEKDIDLSVSPEDIEVDVFADDNQLIVNAIHPIYEQNSKKKKQSVIC